MVGPEIGYAIGAAGVGLTFMGQWVNRRERLRARPVVICHEDRGRHFAKPHGNQAVSVHLTNESAASAFNVRFGVTLGGVAIGWRHDPNDEKPSRINVLRPGERDPPDGSREVLFPTTILLAATGGHRGQAGKIDERSYWAIYQSAAGEWWYTINPTKRCDDFTVRRIRSRRWGVLRRHEGGLAKKASEGERVLMRILSEAMAVLPEHTESKPDDADSVQVESDPPPKPGP